MQETLRLVTIVISSASIATAGWMAQGSQPITPIESATSSADAALYEKASEHHISRTFDEPSERGIELAAAKKRAIKSLGRHSPRHQVHLHHAIER